MGNLCIKYISTQVICQYKKYPNGVIFYLFPSEYIYMDTQIFWARVKTLIKEQGFTQESLAERCNIPPRTLIGWINKQRLPDAESAVLISAALHTTVEYLVTGNQALEKERADKLVKDIQDLLTAYNS